MCVCCHALEGGGGDSPPLLIPQDPITSWMCLTTGNAHTHIHTHTHSV